MKRIGLVLTGVFVLALAGFVISQAVSNDFVELYLDKSAYLEGEELQFYGKVVDNYKPLANRDLGIQISSEKTVVFVDQVKTNEKGEFNGSVLLSFDEGNYTFFAAVEGTSNTRDFQMLENNADIEFSTDKQMYQAGENVNVSGKVSLNGQGLNDKIVAVQINNELQGLVFVDQVKTNGNGNFTSSFKIPSNSIKGRYLVFVSSTGLNAFKSFSVQ